MKLASLDDFEAEYARRGEYLNLAAEPEDAGGWKLIAFQMQGEYRTQLGSQVWPLAEYTFSSLDTLSQFVAKRWPLAELSVEIDALAQRLAVWMED